MKKIMFIGNGFDILHGIYIKFNVFVNSNIFQNNIKSHKKYFSNNEYLKFSSKTELWSQFEDYCKYIVEQNNIQGFSFMKKICSIFQKWFELQNNNEITINEELQEFISLNNIETIVSFNYTNTPKIYGFENFYFKSNTERKGYAMIDLWKGKNIMLHAYQSREIEMILGHDKNKLISKKRIVDQWKEDIKFNPKKQLLETIKNSKEINEIVFLGFSFGDSDQDIINFVQNLIKGKKQVIIYFHQEINNSIKSNFKKSKFLDIRESPF